MRSSYRFYRERRNIEECADFDNRPASALGRWVAVAVGTGVRTLWEKDHQLEPTKAIPSCRFSAPLELTSTFSGEINECFLLIQTNKKFSHQDNLKRFYRPS